MKRKSNLYQQMLEYENVLSVSHDVLKKCHNKEESLAFRRALNTNIYDIITRLKNYEYEFSSYRIFLIWEPKYRIIMSERLDDKIVNHLISRYILLPLEKYRIERNDNGSIKNDYSNTQKLFNHLYENPEVGDNEARLCIITRPTYDDKIDNNEHWALKTGSAGARYYFMLTGPEGATWTAHLTNYDDFDFSNSKTDDFAANTDDYGNDDVRMVTHGIARDKPYIIQIIAKKLYTGYQPGMSGETTEKNFNEDGYDQFKKKSKDEWKTYFDDGYLTDWGEGKWNAEEVVDTYFYITVKLKDGQDYVLKINPSYENPEYNINAGTNDFPFQKKRRYAGTDTHIWIRQIRAQHGIEFLEELAENESGIWWKDNQYWNPNHTWGNK